MKLILLALLPLLAHAQQLQPVTSVQQDCGKFSTPIRIAGTYTTATVDNRQAGCDGWVVTYSSNGFSGVSVLLQSAPLAAGGLAGSFVSFAGTITAGPNPATLTTQSEIRATGYFPYVNVQITTVGTGYLQASIYGFKSNPNSGSGASGGCPGTTATPCQVIGNVSPGGAAATLKPVIIGGVSLSSGLAVSAISDPNGGLFINSGTPTTTDGQTPTGMLTNDIDGSPLFLAQLPFVWNGTTFDKEFVCTQRAILSSSSSGNQQLIALSGGTTIRICAIHFTTGTPENVTITTGTGVNCGTGTATIDSYISIVNFDPQFGPSAALRGGSGNAVCINPAVAQAFAVTAIYAQF